jgi:hypothetical protein
MFTEYANLRANGVEGKSGEYYGIDSRFYPSPSTYTSIDKSTANIIASKIKGAPFGNKVIEKIVNDMPNPCTYNPIPVFCSTKYSFRYICLI